MKTSTFELLFKFSRYNCNEIYKHKILFLRSYFDWMKLRVIFLGINYIYNNPLKTYYIDQLVAIEQIFNYFIHVLK